jgi:hypothetical protein
VGLVAYFEEFAPLPALSDQQAALRELNLPHTTSNSTSYTGEIADRLINEFPQPATSINRYVTCAKPINTIEQDMCSCAYYSDLAICFTS